MVRLSLLALGVMLLGQAPHTDLDTLMARAIERRDVDRTLLDDYILDETETFTVVGPDKAPLYSSRRDYSYYVKDGFHIRSPLRVDGIPVPETDRREYEKAWLEGEQARRAYRAGRAPLAGTPSVNEPRFVSEAYFLDFRFDPGNYYLAAREQFGGHDVLRVDYLPHRLFNDEPTEAMAVARRERNGTVKDEPRKASTDALERKLNKTSIVTLWVDPALGQIVKYSFRNVRPDFLPGRWLVHPDDLLADMQMQQPFPGVWLPEHVGLHGTATTAAGTVTIAYAREFSNYRRADVTSRITVPKQEAP